MYESTMRNSADYADNHRQLGVDGVAAVLLELKNTKTTAERETASKYKCMREEYKGIVRTTISMSSIVAVENSAWRRMFQHRTFQLCMMREIVRNILCHGRNQYEYPDIQGTVIDMQNVHMNGYVVIKQTVTKVLQQL